MFILACGVVFFCLFQYHLLISLSRCVMHATSLVIKQALWQAVNMTNSFSSSEIFNSEIW